jgi:hypothetical protein
MDSETLDKELPNKYYAHEMLYHLNDQLRFSSVNKPWFNKIVPPVVNIYLKNDGGKFSFVATLTGNKINKWTLTEVPVNMKLGTVQTEFDSEQIGSLLDRINQDYIGNHASKENVKILKITRDNGNGEEQIFPTGKFSFGSPDENRGRKPEFVALLTILKKFDTRRFGRFFAKKPPIITIKLDNNNSFILKGVIYKDGYMRNWQITTPSNKTYILQSFVDGYGPDEYLFTPLEFTTGTLFSSNLRRVNDGNETLASVYSFWDFLVNIPEKITEITLVENRNRPETVFPLPNGQSQFGRRKNRCTVDDDIRYLQTL